MDFTIKKPSHFIVFLVVLGAFFLLIIYPLIEFFLTIFGIIPPLQIPDISTYTGLYRIIFEIILLLFQIILVFIIILLGVPFLWYKVVNKFSLKEMFKRLQLRREGLTKALQWGFFGVIAAFVATIAVNLVLMQFKINLENLSNIQDLELLFSLPSLFILVTLQPIGEEIFFRGFLLDKLSGLRGKNLAIIVTALLFGLSHLSYLRDYWVAVYTTGMATVFGLIFGIIVVKTKNLYASIFAHILINVTSLTLYIFNRSLGF